MIEDNFEPEEPEQDQEQKAVPWNLIFGGIGILCLLLLGAMVFMHFWKRHRRRSALEAAFHQEDDRKAVAAVFDDCLQLHQAFGIRRRNCSIYAYGPEVGASVHENLEQSFAEAARIYQKAAFSLTEITEEEKFTLITYRSRLLQEIKQQCSLPKRALLKWIKGLY